MIEIGAIYQLTFGTDADKSMVYGVAKEFNHPLLLLKEHAGGKEVVYNLGSLALISIEKR